MTRVEHLQDEHYYALREWSKKQSEFSAASLYWSDHKENAAAVAELYRAQKAVEEIQLRVLELENEL
jgi:hypothetical protein